MDVDVDGNEEEKIVFIGRGIILMSAISIIVSANNGLQKLPTLYLISVVQY